MEHFVKKIKRDSKGAYQGFMLIELLITMMIGIVLLNALMRLYLSSEKSVYLQNTLSNIQNDASEMLFLLEAEIKKSGNIGCARLTADFPITPYHEYHLTPGNKLISSADELIVRYADYPVATLLDTMHHTGVLRVSQQVKFSAGDILLISNCQRAEIFQVLKARIQHDVQEILSTAPLHDLYEKNAEISYFKINRFYLAKTNRTYRDGSSIPALFGENINHEKFELIANISRLKINYQLQHGVEVEFEVTSPPLKKQWHAYVAL